MHCVASIEREKMQLLYKNGVRQHPTRDSYYFMYLPHFSVIPVGLVHDITHCTSTYVHNNVHNVHNVHNNVHNVHNVHNNVHNSVHNNVHNNVLVQLVLRDVVT